MVTSLGIWILTISIVTAALYVWDKRAAIKGRPRVPEKTLLTLSLLGGWPGGLIAGYGVRHKTQKISYRIKFAACVVINLIGLAVLLMRMG